MGSVFTTLILLSLTAVGPVGWSTDCVPSLAALAANGDGASVSLDEQLQQMASLYSLVLQGSIPKDEYESLLAQLAQREKRSEIELSKEIELLSPSPTEARQRREEREARKEAEYSKVLLGLEPYLKPIGRDHRKVIEDTLIRPGLVSPLSFEEVEFRFKAEHRFLVSREGFHETGVGRIGEVSFAPGHDFAIGKVPVTQLLYFLAALGEEGVDPTPSYFREGEGSVALDLDGRTFLLKPNHPVENVSFSEAEAHALRLSRLMKVSYTLPDEDQWEFANRAGSTLKFHFGDDPSLLSRYGWFKGNSGGSTHEVGQLSENGFDLYDTHGNVKEWTSTWDGRERVLRGGSYGSAEKELRSAYRTGREPKERGRFVGFRLIRQIGGNTRPSRVYTFGDLEAEESSSALTPGGPR
jgi:hypothetical protein